ncbi:MAG: hypothetical protein Q9M50_11495 [Methylococcales bacterium]|nr:hypothetical protein [Methylococcales bacterium]
MKNKILIRVVCGLLISTGISQAENEAIFDEKSGTLIIPKVLIGTDYYEVNMQHKREALDFEVINYTKIKANSIEYAPIQTVDIQILESFPVQVNVVAKGVFSDGCGNIDKTYSKKQGETFTIIITQKRIGEVCIAALVPFEKVIPLDVNGLTAGSYNINVNHIKSSFIIPIDNAITN